MKYIVALVASLALAQAITVPPQDMDIHPRTPEAEAKAEADVTAAANRDLPEDPFAKSSHIALNHAGGWASRATSFSKTGHGGKSSKHQAPPTPPVDGTGEGEPWEQPLTENDVCVLFDEMIYLLQEIGAGSYRMKKTDGSRYNVLGKLDDWRNIMLELQSRIDSTTNLSHVGQLQAANCYADYAKQVAASLKMFAHRANFIQSHTAWRCKFYEAIGDTFQEYKSTAVKMYGAGTDKESGRPRLMADLFDDALPEWWSPGVGDPDPRSSIADWVRRHDEGWTGGAFARAQNAWFTKKYADGHCPPF